MDLLSRHVASSGSEVRVPPGAPPYTPFCRKKSRSALYTVNCSTNSLRYRSRLNSLNVSSLTSMPSSCSPTSLNCVAMKRWNDLTDGGVLRGLALFKGTPGKRPLDGPGGASELSQHDDSVVPQADDANTIYQYNMPALGRLAACEPNICLFDFEDWALKDDPRGQGCLHVGDPTAARARAGARPDPGGRTGWPARAPMGPIARPATEP